VKRGFEVKGRGNKPLKGVSGSLDKFVPKLATICKLLQAAGSPHWKDTELLFEKKHLIPALQQLIVSV